MTQETKSQDTLLSEIPDRVLVINHSLWFENDPFSTGPYGLDTFYTLVWRDVVKTKLNDRGEACAVVEMFEKFEDDTPVVIGIPYMSNCWPDPTTATKALIDKLGEAVARTVKSNDILADELGKQNADLSAAWEPEPNKDLVGILLHSLSVSTMFTDWSKTVGLLLYQQRQLLLGK